jgi:hypothetical protein
MAGYKIKGLAQPTAGGSGYRIKGPAQQPQMQEQPMPQQQQGIGDIPGDFADMMANLFMGAGEKAMQAPEEISEGFQPFREHPLKASARAGGNVLSSLLEGGKQLYNLPFNINTYLGEKGVPIFKQTMGLANKLKIGDTGLENAVLGAPQSGDQFWKDVGTAASLIAGPEVAGVKIPAVTAKGITKQIVKTKAARIAEAKKDYGSLFEKAANEGITHAKPPKSVTASEAHIVKHSEPRFHESLQTYTENPTIENAHWAQSELGALERHLDSLSKKNGLTPSQIKTLKAVQQARKGIKESMFSKNAMGANPKLGKEYDQLAAKYKEEVVPYTSLEDIHEYEAGKMRPKTVVKNLQNDEEFMTKLAKEYPGLKLHTKTAKRAMIGLLGLMGYDEVKKLIRELR